MEPLKVGSEAQELRSSGNNPELDLSSYKYEFPANLVAQKPADKRDEARLLVLDRKSGAFKHKKFLDIIEFIEPGDCLVINETRVLPSRFFGKKATGGKVEVLALAPFEKESSSGAIEALLKPKLKQGEKIYFPDSSYALVEETKDSGPSVLEISGTTLINLVKAYGKMPLPPYIKRARVDEADVTDNEDYQTIYARQDGSIAAPTAGLHFTQELLDKVASRGINVARIILHVGWGTFRSIKDNDITVHRMLPEFYSISEEAAGIVNETKAKKKRVIAVGTTSTRALEASFTDFPIKPASGQASIFIYPGFKFNVIDGLITNFHLPCSTPLLLTSAFSSRETILGAYAEAIRQEYRLFSYGDAMFIK